MSVSVSYNKLIKRIKVNDIVSTEFYKVDDIAYHMLCSKVLDLNAIDELLKLDDEWFGAAIENALNVLDLNNEE